MGNGKESVSIIARGLGLAVSVASILVSPACGAQIEFTDEQFEKAAYDELFSSIGPFTETAPKRYCEGRDFYESNFRLVPGRITFYDITGNPNAYVYIGYFGSGETPALEGLISKAKEVYDERENYLSPREPVVGERIPYREFLLRIFPELLYTDYIILGVNVDEAAFIDGHYELPPIIMVQKKAEDAAREYFGADDVKFVRYIWGSKINGYEYSYGENRVIIPFVYRGGYVDAEQIYTREEVDANIGEFTQRDEALGEYMKGAYKNFWDRRLEQEENATSDSKDSY